MRDLRRLVQVVLGVAACTAPGSQTQSASKRSTEPAYALSKTQQAELQGFACLSNGVIAAWGGDWLYTRKDLPPQSASTAFFETREIFPHHYIRQYAIFNFGEVLQLTEKKSQGEDRDQVWIRGSTGKSTWEAGGPIAEVAVTPHATWINQFDRMVRLDSAGRPAQNARLNEGELDLIDATDRSFVVCKNAAGRMRPTVASEAGEASCRSSDGWHFEGDWTVLTPFVCGNFIVEFQDFRGPNRGEFFWSKAKIRERGTGRIVHAHERSNGPQSLSCWLNKSLIDTETGSLFSLPGLEPAGRLSCGHSKGRVRWASGDNCNVCLNTDGVIEPVATVN